MALKYGGKIYRSLEEQVRANMEDISTHDEEIEELKTKSGGGVAVELQSVEGATQGTLTAEQLATLQEADVNYILLNNEIYLLMDKQASDGYLTYSHVGVANSKQMVKTLTITISALSWVIIEMEIGGGGTGKYLHKIKFGMDSGGGCIFLYKCDRETPFENAGDLYDYVRPIVLENSGIFIDNITVFGELISVEAFIGFSDRLYITTTSGEPSTALLWAIPESATVSGGTISVTQADTFMFPGVFAIDSDTVTQI